MALLKVFVSSTCYDLNILRSQLRSFINLLGHEPIMSDFNDVLFDPRIHTHESCVKEIANADCIILIIGSRYGGKAIPKAVENLNFSKLKAMSSSTATLDSPENISITQLEVLKAIDSDLPIFTFIDGHVMHEHLMYEKNKGTGIADKMEFPSIDNRKTATYIFEFINFLRMRSKNNSIVEFNKFDDIQDFLKKQWSALFQRLLYEQRLENNESKRIEAFSEDLKDIKSLILSSITSIEAQKVGKGVIKYRRFLEFFYKLNEKDFQNIIFSKVSFDKLLKKFRIKEIISDYTLVKPYGFPSTFLLKDDGTFFISRTSATTIKRFEEDWNNFNSETDIVKNTIISAITEMIGNEFNLRYPIYKDQQFDIFIKEMQEELKHSNNNDPIVINLTE